MLINTGRADLVDNAALREAVEAARAAGGARRVPRRAARHEDVRGVRVLGPSPSGGLVYGTPHIAAATDQAQLAIATETVRVIRSFLLEGIVPNVVNVPVVQRRAVPARDPDDGQGGDVRERAHVIKRHGINVEEVTNTVFEGGVAACAKLRLCPAPDRGVPGRDQGVRRGAPRRPGYAADPGVMFVAARAGPRRSSPSRWRSAGLQAGSRGDAQRRRASTRGPVDAGDARRRGATSASADAADLRPTICPPRRVERRADRSRAHLLEALGKGQPGSGV